MNFAATYKLESKACPGVIVTLRRMGPKPRAAAELAVSAARGRQRIALQAAEKAGADLQGILAAIPGLPDAIKALPHDEHGNLIGGVTPEIVAMFTPEAWSLSSEKAAREDEAAAIVRSEVNPAFLNAAVKSFDGIDSDGQPYTAAMLADLGPVELFDEVVDAINRDAYPTKAQAENLSLPTTSGAPVDGSKTNTSAPTVN